MSAPSFSGPPWFQDAIATPGESLTINREGCSIHGLAWGARGAPGMILVHGGGAHAHWWDASAPFWADRYRVVAPDLRGMGDSDHQAEYHLDDLSDDLFALAEAAGAEPPYIVVGHSFGGFVTMKAALRDPERLDGIVVIDSPIRPMSDPHVWDPEKAPFRTRRSYASFEEAVKRFRLVPAQPCENEYYKDYIAHHSVRETEEGWTWKFDPGYFMRLEGLELRHLLPGLMGHLAYIYGGVSGLITPAMVAHVGELFGPQAPVVAIPGAHHHVLIDQPVALVVAIQGCIRQWRALEW